jgi:hypothetical protein
MNINIDKSNSFSEEEKIKIINFMKLVGRDYEEIDNEIIIKSNIEQNIDIFYKVNEEVIQIFTKSVNLLSEKHEKNKYNEFITKSYPKPGETPYKNVRRLIPSMNYVISKGGMSEKDSRLMAKKIDSRESLIDIIMKNFIRKGYKEKYVGIFFSGGVDSLTLALICQNLNIRFKLYIGEEIPKYCENQKDVLRAIDIAEKSKWDYEVVQIDYNKHVESEIKYYRERNPLSPHLSLIFELIARKMNADGINVALTGQNLDNYYNYGLTNRFKLTKNGIISVARGFFVTDFYLSSFSTNILHRIIAKSIAFIGLAGYRKITGKSNIRLPKSLMETVHALESSPEYVPFINSSDYANLTDDDLNLENARIYLLRNKIDAYSLSGPSVSIITACEQNSIECDLPYSNMNCINWYLNRSHPLSELFYGKKTLYNFVKSTSPEVFKIAFIKTRISENINYHNWVEKEFLNSKFGKHLSEKYFEQKKLKKYSNAITLSTVLSMYWISNDK